MRLLVLGQGPQLPIPGVTVRTVGSMGGTRRILGPDWPSALVGNLGERDVRLPLQVRASLDRRFVSALRDEVARERPTVLHAYPSTMAPFLWTVDGPLHRHLDLIDALSVVMDGDARNARQPLRSALRLEAHLLRRFEAGAVARSDSASLVSAADQESAPGLERAEVIPNGVDPSEFPFESPVNRPPTVVFIGNMNWPPNVEAARRIVRDIFPRVRELRPDARLRIVGVGGGGRVHRLGLSPGVEIVGAVARVAPELHNASCTLIPMWSGAGMKNKALEAFSSGTPVVSNELGLKGIAGIEAGRHVLVDESAQGLANACVRLFDDAAERRHLAAQAATLVHREYTWAKQAERLMELYFRETGL